MSKVNQSATMDSKAPDTISFELDDKPVLELKAGGEVLVNGKHVASDWDVYKAFKAWLQVAHQEVLGARQVAEEKSTQVIYVFDAVKDREALKQFNDYLVDVHGLDADHEEPIVIYQFHTFRDRYELAEFQRGPDYGRAIDQFGSWLRTQHKYAPDGMPDDIYAVWDTVWDTWCESLDDNDAQAE